MEVKQICLSVFLKNKSTNYFDKLPLAKRDKVRSIPIPMPLLVLSNSGYRTLENRRLVNKATRGNNILSITRHIQAN